METQNSFSISFSHPWEKILKDREAIDDLEKNILPEYLKSCRWFGGKARKLTTIRVAYIFSISSAESLQLNQAKGDISFRKIFHFLILKIKYQKGKPEEYLLPAALVPSIENIPAKAIISNSNLGWLIDAIYDEAFRRTIFIHLFNSAEIKSQKNFLFFEKGSALHEEHFNEFIPSRVLDADQSNSSLIYDEKFFLKFYRKLFTEINPDVEVVKFLSEKTHFTHIPAFAGTFYWKKSSVALVTLGMMQQKVDAIKDAWSLAGDYLNEYLLSLSAGHTAVPDSSIHLAVMLGKLTAEMHQALSADASDPGFAPEKFNDEYNKWLLNNCDSLVKHRLRLIKDCYSSLDEKGKELSKFFILNATRIREYFLKIKSNSFQSLRIRIHGDYHLGQLLFNGTDYTVLDFEGEPESSITDRKIKHSSLKDVAGMLRSFHYAVSAKLYFNSEAKNFHPEKIESAVSRWYNEVTQSFMNSYRETIKGNRILTADEPELKFLLQFHLLEKAVYELGYELNARPDWVKIPLKGIQQVLKELSG